MKPSIYGLDIKAPRLVAQSDTELAYTYPIASICDYIMQHVASNIASPSFSLTTTPITVQTQPASLLTRNNNAASLRSVCNKNPATI